MVENLKNSPSAVLDGEVPITLAENLFGLVCLILTVGLLHLNYLSF